MAESCHTRISLAALRGVGTIFRHNGRSTVSPYQVTLRLTDIRSVSSSHELLCVHPVTTADKKRHNQTQPDKKKQKKPKSILLSRLRRILPHPNRLQEYPLENPRLSARLFWGGVFPDGVFHSQCAEGFQAASGPKRCSISPPFRSRLKVVQRKEPFFWSGTNFCHILSVDQDSTSGGIRFGTTGICVDG